MFTGDFREMDAFYSVIPQIESCLEDGILCGQYANDVLHTNEPFYVLGWEITLYNGLCLSVRFSLVWPNAYSYYNLCERDYVYFMTFLACIDYIPYINQQKKKR